MKCKGGFGTKTGFGDGDENWAPITRDSIESGVARHYSPSVDASIGRCATVDRVLIAAVKSLSGPL